MLSQSSLRRKLPPRGSFERRLLVALVLFSVVPVLAVLGVASWAVYQGVMLSGAPAAWERTAASGRVLLERADSRADPALARAAERHRDELSASLVQARRWRYLARESLRVILALALLLALLLTWLSVRSARRLARGMARPIHELVGWAERIARDEPLPAAPPGATESRGDFGVLRAAFRGMAAELALSRERALEAERTRTWAGMARQVAHELKNPLTPMRFALRALHSAGDVRSPAAAEALQVLTAEAERLEDLARAFAQFGRLPEGPPSDVDLREMLEYLLRTHAPPNARCELHAPPTVPMIHGHYDALSRAFVNLLLNAGDAIAPNSASAPATITISIEPGEAEVAIAVADNGSGIAPGPLKHIWEPDFTTKARGTGLGLAVVRHTVEMHGGRVSARNLSDGGAEFRVVLPLGGKREIGNGERATGNNNQLHGAP